MKIFSQSISKFPFKILQNVARLVELDKLRLTTRKEEAKDLASAGSADPSMIIIPPSASKGGVAEKLIKVGNHPLPQLITSYHTNTIVCLSLTLFVFPYLII